MPLLETLAIEIGLQISTAVARNIFRSDNSSHQLEQLLVSNVQGFRERRRARRQLEGLADNIAERLESFLEIEFASLTQNERQSAVISAGKTLDRGQITPNLLAQLDLDATALEQHVRSTSPRTSSHLNTLSSDGLELHDLIVTEACTYIVELSQSTMGPQAQVLEEVLLRESYLQDLVQQVLDALPGHGLVHGSEDDEFEMRYRREIARRLDKLELFGISVDESIRRYALSVAYISLSARQNPGHPGQPSIDPFLGREDEDTTSPDFMRIDDAIAGCDRVIIQGIAGSGKTTLLQWLAVQSSRTEFHGELEAWNGTVPFFIQLRRYAHSELPQPEVFTEHIAAPLHGIQPNGWVHRVLSDGRGLVLIDGIDELPQAKWPEVQDWLTGLAENFPESRYVVTSRPGALQDGWLRVDGACELELESMSPHDIATFVDHWHEAAKGSLGGIRDESIADYAASIKSLIRETPSLRSLATVPLLAAMICALHLERRRQLPRDRMQLYETAMEMLLERRDVERRIPLDAGSGLSRQQKGILLQKLAFWLALNDQSDIPKDRAVEHVERELASMPGIHEDAQAVFGALLRRSGLIREPVVGRIDFVHRTFQEYLAAKQAVADDHRELLINNSHLESWREIIVLAAGHARASEREALIRGLLDRGYSEPDQAHRLHLLAVACLETVPQLSPELTQSLTERLGQLLPPTNMTEARAVASAGDLAAPLLEDFAAERATTTAACVRALALIGTERALVSLESYGPDYRVTVSRELLRAWPNFDAETFANRVLRLSILEYGRLRVEDAALLPGIKYLERLRSLSCRLDGGADLSHLGRNDALRSIQLVNARLVDLHPLDTCQNLSSISISRSETISSLSALSDHPNVKQVRLSRCPAIHDIEPLASCPELRSVSLWHLTGVRDFSPIGQIQQLDDLEITGSEVLNDIDFLSQSRHLSSLKIRECPSLESIAGVPSELQSVHIEEVSTDLDFAPLSSLEHLTVAILQGGDGLTSLSFLRGKEHLTALALSDCWGLEDLAGLSGLHALKTLTIFDAPKVSDLSPIAALTDSLEQLVVVGVSPEAEYGWIRELRESTSVLVDVDPGSRDDFEERGRPVRGLVRHPSVILSHPRRLRRLYAVAGGQPADA